MAKKSNVAADAINFDGLTDYATGTALVVPVAADSDLPEVAVSLTKGKDAKGKVAFFGYANGRQGDTKGTVTAAMNALFTALGYAPAAYALPGKIGDFRFPEKNDNQPKDPTALADLSVERQEALRHSMEALEAEYGDMAQTVASSQRATRETTRKVASRLSEVRAGLTKPEWAIFRTMTDNPALADFLSEKNKNRVSEYMAYAAIPDDLLDLLPEEKVSPKSVLEFVRVLRARMAEAIAHEIKTRETGATVTHCDVLTRWIEAPNEADLTYHDCVRYLAQTHLSNVTDKGALFQIAENGEMEPARDADGKHVTYPVYGSEGCDELVSAVCKAAKAWKPAAVKAAAEAEAKAVKKLAAAIATFANMSVTEAARHLFNILASRIDEGTDESRADSLADVGAIVAQVSDWLTAIGDETMTVDDVINPDPDAPTDEGEAEDEGDAAA